MLRTRSAIPMLYRPGPAAPLPSQPLATRPLTTTTRTAAAAMSGQEAAKDFIQFVNDSPTPYHAVASAAARLRKAGFTPLREKDAWATTLQPGGKYYVTRNASSIIAFAVGTAWVPGNPVSMVGAHTDSPALRLKPVSNKSKAGFLQVGVETYGGGIWHSWFDRDLSVAGRLLVRGDDGDITSKLVKVDKPVCRIPTLAIHFTRSGNFEPNKETELFPIAGLAEAELNKVEKKEGEGEGEGEGGPLAAIGERHHPHVIDLVATQAGVPPSSIVDFELLLFDTQPATLGGLNDEFIFAARLDNLGMTYCTIEGLIASSSSDSLKDDNSIRLAACFDHEEVGSTSAQGANSSFLYSILRRVAAAPCGGAGLERDPAAALEQTLARSFFVSADMAHSVHPNYQDKHEADHRPLLNKGTTIKINANQRYATNSPGVVLLQECARRAGVPLQLFVVRNDSLCGSTIGPMVSAKMGVRTLDLGNPQLSMHSIRETGGARDVGFGVGLFREFYESYGELEKKIEVE